MRRLLALLVLAALIASSAPGWACVVSCAARDRQATMASECHDRSSDARMRFAAGERDCSNEVDIDVAIPIANPRGLRSTIVAWTLRETPVVQFDVPAAALALTSGTIGRRQHLPPLLQPLRI